MMDPSSRSLTIILAALALGLAGSPPLHAQANDEVD